MIISFIELRTKSARDKIELESSRIDTLQRTRFTSLHIDQDAVHTGVEKKKVNLGLKDQAAVFRGDGGKRLAQVSGLSLRD
jgi:hypothetical protein